MSQLDRFFLSDKWCLTWPNCIQVARLRGLSDHCLIVLSVYEENWGPKPFRMLKCWVDVPSYKQFVTDQWLSFQIEGWDGFVLKEKFKFLKMVVKSWHDNHNKNLSGRIYFLKDHLSLLDCKEEKLVL
jgi:hypothetical protein